MPMFHTKNVYRLLKRGMDRSRIGDLSIPLLSSVYTKGTLRSICFIAAGGLLLHLLFNGVGTGGSVIPHILGFGLLRPDDVDGDRWVMISRVSTGSQLGNTSTETQLSDLKNEMNRMDGNEVKVFEGAESAATMERDSVSKIADMAENDQFDVLGVWKLDRLTRADPWESIKYLRRIKEAGVTLYSGTHGYFDWNDLYDLKRVYDQVVFAREWYIRIRENAEKGQISQLEEGKWPFGSPPFGYTRDEDNNISRTPRGKAIIPKIFYHYLETENRAETRRQINEDDIPQGEELSDNQIRTILKSELCIGHLTLEGEVFQKCEDLVVVKKDTYRRAQDLLGEREASKSSASGLPDPVNRAAHRYGPDFALTQLGTVTTQCPECGGGLNPYGTTTRLGQETKNYQCEECNWQGPLLSEQSFKEIHGTHPLTCPSCTKTEGFEVSDHPTERFEYEYTCDQCGDSFGYDYPPDKYKRAIARPDLAFRFDEQDTAEDSELEEVLDAESESNQPRLSDFPTQ